MTRVLKVDPDRPDPDAIAEAAAVLKRGGLVAFPTETVYGLGAHAIDVAAVARIFEAKERPATDPLIVHIAHIGQLAAYVSAVPPVARTLGLAFWAGPLTLILPKKPIVPDAVTAGLPSVAVRVPAHRVARALMEMAGVPVAAPSANRFSRPSPTLAAHVLEDLEGRVDLVLDGGPTPIGVESTIVDCTTTPPVLRRPGGVTIEQLRERVPDLVVDQRFASGVVAQRAPGQLARHYAPRARLTLYEGDPARLVERVAADARALVGSGHRVGLLTPEEDALALAPLIAAQAAGGHLLSRTFGARHAPDTAAHALFDALRSLDAEGPDVILATTVGPESIGAAIRDRLVRAAEGRVVNA